MMKTFQLHIHPILTNLIDEKEEALMDFKDELSKFKPKMSVLETAIVKTNDSAKIKSFKQILELQK